MNLADMLCYADIQDLSRIARHYDVAGGSHSKNELIQSILATVTRKDVFEDVISQLSMEDIRFLNSLLFERRDAFSLEELVARANQTKFSKGEHEEWNPRELISRFKERGWLFNGHSHQTKYLFSLPEDLKRRFSDSLAGLFGQQIAPIERAPQVYRDEQHLLSDDLLLFLRCLNQEEAALSADGYMYKRALQQLLGRMSVAEEMPAKSAWRFGYGRRYKEYPARFSLLYDYCYYEGLIIENGAALSLSLQGKERLAAGRKEDLASLYRFWLRLYKGPIPNLASIVHWLDKLAKHWVTVDSLVEVLCKLIKPYYYDTPDAIFEQRILPMLTHLGMIRIGADNERGGVVQMTKLGSGVINGTYVPDEDTINLAIDNP